MENVGFARPDGNRKENTCVTLELLKHEENTGVAWERMENAWKTQVLRWNIWKTQGSLSICVGTYGKRKGNISVA